MGHVGVDELGQIDVPVRVVDEIRRRDEREAAWAEDAVDLGHHRRTDLGRDVLNDVDRRDEVERGGRERQPVRRCDVEAADAAGAPLVDGVLGDVHAVRVPAHTGQPLDVEPVRAADVERPRLLLPCPRDGRVARDDGHEADVDRGLHGAVVEVVALAATAEVALVEGVGRHGPLIGRSRD